ncbi:Sphingomyelin phosphodiesterase [Cordyceps militaris]|uniref:Sphingomyelin phosphodiesterase n=1 Tax=Cordyceps militaris TaxID=73501 RepID=A0A2H4SCC9_CORMI|nr:Sphingomyelin phosphodiesterase [Cordyceps militaris]
MRWATLVAALAAVADVATAIQTASQTALPTRRPEDMDVNVTLPHVPSSKSAEIWDDFKHEATCKGCQSMLALLKALANFGEDVFVTAAQSICKLSKVEDADVCDGFMNLEGPTVQRLLKEISIYGRTSKLLCGAMLGLCNIPAPIPLQFALPPKNVTAPRQRVSGMTPIKVVHFSDIHVDHHYAVGTNTQCTKPVCCRPYTTSDEVGETQNPAGPFGDHNCDTPESLERSMYDAIRKVVPDAAFSIFTGDIVDHHIWSRSKKSNIDEIHASMQVMDKQLNIVYGTVGNHEMSPANLFPSKAYKRGGKEDIKWLYELVAGYWLKSTGQGTQKDISTIGAYAAKNPRGKLRIISINTNMYYRNNFELFHEVMEQDPNGQFEWLVRQLLSAEKEGDRVYIIGHMPMGDIDALHDGSNAFDAIVNRFSDTIAAMFFGHTHVDHFQLHYANYTARNFDSARVMSYIAPALTPTSGMPSFRVYDVDPVTFAVLDAVTYIADMDHPTFQTAGPVWSRYYSAKETYGALLTPPLTDPAAELSPAFWHNVTEVFEADEDAFNKYMVRKSRGWKPQQCSGACRDGEICMLRGGRAQDNCHKSKPDLHLRKRDGMGPAGTHDHCGASGIAMMLSKLVTEKRALERIEAIVDTEGARVPTPIWFPTPRPKKPKSTKS